MSYNFSKELFLIFQEIELFHILGNEYPEKNHYILGNGNPKKNISGSNFPSSKKKKKNPL